MSTDIGIDLSRYQLGWHDEEDYVFKPKKGINTDIVREMSWMKGEPDWMLDYRLKSLQHFERRPMPNWGGDMSPIDFNDIYYYIKPTEGQVDAWDDLPDSIKNTYEKLGIPEAERKYLAGVTAQYEVRGRLPSQSRRPRAQRCDLLRHGHGTSRVPGVGEAVLRQDHPEERQQVRRRSTRPCGAVAASSMSRRV